MRTAVISSSDFNIYACTLVSRLVKEGLPPAAVVCIQGARRRDVYRYFLRNGIRGSFIKALQVLGLRAWPGSRHWGVMECYAQRHGLDDWRTPLPNVCEKQGIAYQRFEKLDDDKTISYLRDSDLHLLLNAGSELYRQRVIEAARLGVFNVHKGWLPAYRGYNVVEWSLLQGHQIGVTLHFVDAGLDTGDVVKFSPIPRSVGDSIDDLRAKSYPLEVDLMLWGIQQLQAGAIPRKPQRKSDGRQYFKMHARLKRLAERNLGRELVYPDRNVTPEPRLANVMTRAG